MSIVSEGYVQIVINEVANLLNLQAWRYKQRTFETKAQNYFGVLIPVILTGSNNGEETTKYIVVKLAPNDERFRVSGALTRFFAREIFAYSTLLNYYKELQAKTVASQRFTMPECYYLSDQYCKEVIVMQDMNAAGYTPFNLGMFLDYDHMTIALMSLTKFHALSFILKENDKLLYEKAMYVCSPLTENNKRYINILIDRWSKAIEKFQDSSPDTVTLLENLKQNCTKFVEATYKDVKGVCICHGDIWKENILFKYEDSKPVSACLIDYQTVRMCSPAYDVLYLITSSTNSELRHKHYHHLLDVYYQTFEQTLVQFGLNPRIIYSRDTFKYDLNIVGPACLIVANTALWLLLGLQKEGHVRSQVVWTTREQEYEAVEKYKDIIKAIIHDYKDYGYI